MSAFNEQQVGLGDQAARLRSLVERAATRPTDGRARSTQRARMIAVASGKGGVGKTSLCVSLGATLAARGSRTTLLDGDLGLANADVLCGELTTDHLGDVLDGTRSVADIALQVSGGFRLVPGGSGISRLANLNVIERRRLVETVDALRTDQDVLLIDCGAGIGASVLTFAAAADMLLVVTTPEPTAIADAYGLIKALVMRPHATTQPRLGIVVNQATSSSQAAAVYKRITTVTRRFLDCHPEFMGCVSQDQHVRDAALRQRPFALSDPRCRAARDVRSLAVTLAQRLDCRCAERGPNTGRIGRFLRRRHPDNRAKRPED